MITPPCPACGSVDVARHGLTAHCRTCETHFSISAVQEPPAAPASAPTEATPAMEAPVAPEPAPPAVTPPAPKPAPAAEPDADWRPARWGVASVAVAGAVAGLLYMVTPGSGGPDHATESPGRRVVDPSAPLVELESVRRGRDAQGDPFWIVTWTNRSDEVFVAPMVTVELLDDDGNVVRAESGRGLYDRVDPGSSTWVHVPVPDAPSYDDARVTVAGPYRPDAPIRQVHLFVDGAGLVSTPTGDVVRAKVRAPGDQPIVVGRVAAVGFGKDGFPVAWAEGTPPTEPLQPVTVWEAEIPVGSHVAEPAIVWTMVAVGLEDL